MNNLFTKCHAGTVHCRWARNCCYQLSWHNPGSSPQELASSQPTKKKKKYSKTHQEKIYYFLHHFYDFAFSLAFTLSI